MYTGEIWNKQDNINNGTAEELLKANPSWAHNDLILIKYGDTVTEHSEVNVIRVNNKFSIDATSEEVMQLYLEKINNKEKEQITLEEQSIKIDILEKEKEQLKIETLKLQDAVNELILNNTTI